MPVGRPLSWWGLLGEGLRLYRARFGNYFALALIDSLVGWGLAAAGKSVLALALVLVLIVVGAAVQTLLFAVAVRAATGQPGVPWEALRRVWVFVVALLIITLAGALGFTLLVVPGVILLTWWAVTPVVVVAEGRGALGALGRSRRLVQGHFWHVLATILAGSILFGVAYALLTLVLTAPVPLHWMWQVLLGGVADPWVPCLLAALYADLVGRGGEGSLGTGTGADGLA